MLSKALLLLCLYTCTILGNKTLPRGPVEVSDCGSEAGYFRLRVDEEESKLNDETCSSVPCELRPDTPYNLQIDFIASGSHTRVSWRLTVVQADGTETIVLENLIGSGSIEAGRLYTLHYLLTPNAVLQGELFDLRLEIFEAIANFKEVCAEAPFTIV